MFSEPAAQALIFSFAAGLATVVGCVPVFFTANKNERLLSVALGTAAGVMLSVSFLDLYPEAERLFRTVFSLKQSVFIAVSCFAAGVFLASLIDRFVPHETFNEQTGGASHKICIVPECYPSPLSDCIIFRKE